LNSQLGIFVYSNGDGLTGITSLTLNHTTNREGIDIENCSSPITINFPNLTKCLEGAYFAVQSSSSLKTLNIPIITSVYGYKMDISSNASLTGINAPLLDFVTGNLNIYGNTALTTLNVSPILNIGGNADITNNALNQTSVDNLLRSFASGQSRNKTLTIHNGTNAKPSSVGSGYRAILTGRGWTVTTN